MKKIIIMVNVKAETITASKIESLAESLEKVAKERHRAKVERATKIREIWDAMDDEEKDFVMSKAGY